MSGDLPKPVVLEEGDVVQVVMLDPVFEWVQNALRSRDLFLFKIPVDDDDLPTYGVGVGRDLVGKLQP